MKKQQNKIKATAGDYAYNIIAGVIFLLLAFVCAYPFYYMLICAFSDNQQVALGKVVIAPIGVHLENFVTIFKTKGILQSAWISTLRTMIGTFSQLLVTSYMAYFFTKQEMAGRKFFYRYVVITMYFSAGMIPIYLNNNMLGLTNNFLVYFVPGLLNVYNMILVKTSIEALPPELEESAMMDGAGHFRCYLNIVLPLQKPILATVGLFAAVNHWNDFFSTKMYITEPDLYTLQFKLYELLQQVRALADASTGDDYSLSAVTPMGIRMALTAVVVLPVMCIYPFIQKHYVKGVMIGAVKG